METTKESRSGGCAPAVRELMLAVEYLRYVCEHAEGKRKIDRKMLSRAMSVGIRINARYAYLMEYHQRATYWEDVWALPASVDLPNDLAHTHTHTEGAGARPR